MRHHWQNKRDCASRFIFSPLKRLKFIIILSLLLTTTIFAEPLIKFDIPQQQTNKALILFAQQSNKTVLFSFDLTKNYQSNTLKGYYSINNGLKKLLGNSGLIPIVSNNNQLSVMLSPPKVTLPKNQVVKQSFDKQVTSQEIEKISVIGSRVLVRTLDDLPVAVDILTAQALTNTGQTEVGRMIQTIAPSFNFASSVISDGTDAIRPATLRGLGPDQTLVLINGKRRHQASLIHINTSVGRGATGTDMNAIPAAAIKHIEILRDGAAAQYGSDAIAGVINIVLNDKFKENKLAVSHGKYSAGDGETTNIDLTSGLSLGRNNYITGTLNYRDRAFTNRAGEHGSCLFTGCIETNDGIWLMADSREATADRKTFRIGDADSKQVALTLNASFALTDGELYGFLMYSNRDNESATFFRHNANENDNAPLQDGDATITQGFLPKIQTNIEDMSYSFGYHHKISSNKTFDISYTYGKNSLEYTTRDTINSSYANYLQFSSKLSANEIRAAIPRAAFAYALELSLGTINIDYLHYFDLFSLALGAEIRTDTYRIFAGDEYSFKDYDTQDGISLFATDRSLGTQGFGGIGPISDVDESRNVVSVYLDAETSVSDNLQINTAGRYDDYQGFGASANFKVALNWSITNSFSVRSAISTGFRAPSMQQLYFNNISTQFVTDPNHVNGELLAVQVGTFRNDSSLALEIGIPELQEENSTNFSLGAIIKVAKNVSLAVDYYDINIENRIVISNKLGYGLSATLDQALTNEKAGKGQFFLNGADTETSGLDIVATWQTSLLDGSLKFIFAGNFTQTKVVDIFTPPGSNLRDISPDNIFAAQDISILEEWQPENRVNVNALYNSNKTTVSLSLNRYGEYTITDGSQQTYSAELLTDLRVKYQLNTHLSFNIGGNNLFNVKPDKNIIGNARSGTIVDSSGNIIVESPGVFTYSRRSAPFGFNGSYYYLGAEYSF
ncbi:MAG: iron complex outermembrane receptor protein [Alteromonadaceae bacterium]|jgi:iron complex outermembrane receptor protein